MSPIVLQAVTAFGVLAIADRLGVSSFITTPLYVWIIVDAAVALLQGASRR